MGKRFLDPRRPRKTFEQPTPAEHMFENPCGMSESMRWSLQVYLMDKRFLDPRRPRKSLKQLTPAEQEERLIPFSPLLPLAPNWFVTYSRSVARLKGERAWSDCCLVKPGGGTRKAKQERERERRIASPSPPQLPLVCSFDAATTVYAVVRSSS